MNNEMVVHDGAAQQQTPPNPLLIAHRILRGRYGLAIMLGLALAIPCGVIGFFALQPLYTSTAMVRVISSRPKLLYTNELNTSDGAIDGEIQAHAVRMRDQQFLFVVASRDDIAELDLPQGYAGVARLSELLKVTPQRQSDFISVSVDHEDKNVAYTIVNALVEEYIVYQDRFDSIKKMEDAIVRIKDRRMEDLDRLLDDRVELVAKWRFQEPTTELAGIQERRAQLDQLIFEEELRLSQLGLKLSDVIPPEGSVAAGDPAAEIGEATLDALQESQEPEPERPLTSDEIADRMALYDEEMAVLVEQRKIQRRTVEQLKLSGLKPGAYQLRKAQNTLDNMEFKIGERIANFDKELLADMKDAMGEEGSGSPREQVTQRVQRFHAIRQRLDERFELISQAAQEFGDVDREIAKVEAAIAMADTRLEQLQAEKQMTLVVGRAEKFSDPTRPVLPAKDRRIPLAALGFLGGGGLGVMSVVGFGFLRPRLRYIDEVEDARGAGTLLGSLPDLTDGDPEAAELAALSIHHIRGALEIDRRSRDGDRGSVITLTSASPGDGKTSVALSLATSFAIAGHRTAIIDADMIGQNLSRELGLEGLPGLVEGLAHQRLNGEIHPTPTENLSAVPVGDVDSFAPERLNIDRLRNFFNALRDEYDFVIVDTGPILGSIEANLISSIADDTILVVSRGRNPRLARAAEERLRRLNANVRGVVFNRARKHDFSSSMSTASLRTFSQVTSMPRRDSGTAAILKSKAADAE